ncbi:MAG: four helix bundle protein [Candidatus Saccharimonadaceae bacterium]
MEPELEKAVTFFRFEDLRIYHKAINYYDFVFEKINAFPDDKATIAGSCLVNAAQNIGMNIANGSALNKSLFTYYLELAKQSVRECLIQTTLAQKQLLLTETEATASRQLLMEMTKMIGALITALHRSSGIMQKDPK